MPRVPSSKVSTADAQFSTSIQPVPIQWRSSASNRASASGRQLRRSPHAANRPSRAPQTLLAFEMQHRPDRVHAETQQRPATRRCASASSTASASRCGTRRRASRGSRRRRPSPGDRPWRSTARRPSSRRTSAARPARRVASTMARGVVAGRLQHLGPRRRCSARHLLAATCHRRPSKAWSR